MQPLIPRLNELILQFASKLEYSVSDHAPDSFQSLVARGSSLVVWAGASDHTIYADSAVNWAFRAWHDSLHLSLNAPFSFEGELYVAREQARLIGSDLLAEVLLAEVGGQALYLQEHGIFPVDQLAYIKAQVFGK